MRLPLRGFQLVSDTLVYSGDTAQVNFSTKTQNFTRAAIIGIGIGAASPLTGLFTFLDRLEVAGRPYRQGDVAPIGLPIGLLSVGAVPGIAGVVGDYKRGYFPGSKLPLSDGTYCSGILLNGREDVRMQVTRLAGQPAIRNVVLHCLEFPRGAYPRGVQDGIDQLWDRFAAGIGQFHCVANLVQLVAATALQTTLEALVNPPHRQNSRRVEIRGGLLDPAIPQFDEPGYGSIALQVFGQGAGATPTSNAGVGARNVTGHATLHYTDMIGLDFERDSRSLILVAAPPFAAASRLILLTCFEGTDDKGVKLCGPAVF